MEMNEIRDFYRNVGESDYSPSSFNLCGADARAIGSPPSNFEACILVIKQYQNLLSLEIRSRSFSLTLVYIISLFF